jgi:hypothetical protein
MPDPRRMPSLDSLDRLPAGKKPSIEEEIQGLRQLAESPPSRRNELRSIHLRMLAGALEDGGVPKAVRLMQTLKENLHEDDYGPLTYLVPDDVLKALKDMNRLA